jgi:hypothetical protein
VLKNGIIVNNKLEWMWKETIVVLFVYNSGISGANEEA